MIRSGPAAAPPLLAPRRRWVWPCVTTGVALSIVGMCSITALAVVVLDGAWAVWVLLAGAGVGDLVARAIAPRSLPRGERAVLAWLLGAGILPLIVLGGGAAGWMDQTGWRIAAGLMALWGAWITRDGWRHTSAATDGGAAWSWAWALAGVPLGLSLIVAALPPGLLWIGEGNGYDVLEYHLAAPKEFLAAGRIGFLPHNIYSNFPLNAEMLYLLAMILRGGAIESVFTCQLIHVGLGVLACAAVWFAARPLGTAAATVAAVSAATCPMVAYLSGLAYVENGLVLAAAGAIGCVARAFINPAAVRRWMLLGGAFVGIASAYKYSGVPLVGGGLTLLLMAFVFAFEVDIEAIRRASDHPLPFGTRLAAAALFCLASLLPVAPWLARNSLNTGNPLFPLANGVFHTRTGVWSDQLAARWIEGHEPDSQYRTASARIGRLARTLFASPEFATLPSITIMLGAGLALSRRSDRARPVTGRYQLVMVSVIALGFGAYIWTTATHLVARFAIPLVAPLALILAALSARPMSYRASMWPNFGVPLSWPINIGFTLWLFYEGNAFRLAPLAGDTSFITRGEWPEYGYLGSLNRALAEGGRVLIVGEARTLYLEGAPPQYDYRVVFNRSPFAEIALTASPAQTMTWLREHGFTHVFVHWGEMRRLRQSRYGFWPGVDEPLFERLSAAGLRAVEQFRYSDSAVGAYATLFEVPMPPAETRSK